MKKLIVTLVIAITLVNILQIPMSATVLGKELPLNNNTLSANVTFTIDSNGFAIIYASYTGYSGITTGGTITTKIQKNFWVFFGKQ